MNALHAHTEGVVTPFAASILWWRRSLSEGRPFAVTGKELARTVLRGDRLLSVPVAGGAPVLKHAGVNPFLSEHGKWRREHIGAWNAIYGRTPYFEHIFPGMEAIYRESEQRRMTLGEFNACFCRYVSRFLGLDCIQSEECAGLLPEGVIREAREKVTPSFSIFDALFRFGKETLFALLPIDDDMPM